MFGFKKSSHEPRPKMNYISGLKKMHKTYGQNNKEIPFSKIFKNLESCYDDILSGKSKNQCDEEGYFNKEIIKYIRLSNTPNDLKLLEESYRILKMLNFINSQMKEKNLTKYEDILNYCKLYENSCDITTLCNKSLSSNNCIFSLEKARESESKKNDLKQKYEIMHRLEDVQEIKSVKREKEKTDRGSVNHKDPLLGRLSVNNKDPLLGRFFPETDPLTGQNTTLRENSDRMPKSINAYNSVITKGGKKSSTSAKTSADPLLYARPFKLKNFKNETNNSHTTVKTPEQGDHCGIELLQNECDNDTRCEWKEEKCWKRLPKKVPVFAMDSSDDEIEMSTPESDSAKDISVSAMDSSDDEMETSTHESEYEKDSYFY
jgi:hypothetical protein